MVSITTVVLIGYPLLVLGICAAYVYVDAPEYGMDPTKWAAIAFFVPIFGLFAYLLERSERKEKPDREMFEDGVFEIHESRADDTRLVSGTETIDDIRPASEAAREEGDETGAVSRADEEVDDAGFPSGADEAGASDRE